MNKKLRQFAHSCVVNYATHNTLDDCYTLDYKDLSSFDRDEFVALLIEHNPALASEACGSDNILWADKMLPALNKYLKNSTDPEEAHDFSITWKICIGIYFKPFIEELLENALEIYNQDYGRPASYEKSYGVSQHGAL